MLIREKGYARGFVILSIVLMCSLVAPACTSKSSLSKIQVVTTNNIITDWITQIGGDNVEVLSLLAAGADPHTFQPGAADVASVARAGVIFTIGLGMEGTWLTRLLENAAADADRVISLGEHVEPLVALEDEENSDGKVHENNTEHSHGIYDPHFWWDPLRVKLAIEKIAQHLILIDPDNANIYSQNKIEYMGELDKLDARINVQVTQIPVERRKIVTSHDTMQYFAVRYGFETAGSIFFGVTTEQEPSPAELASLTQRIKALEVPAIFTETTVSDRLARALSSETGIKIVRLYSDSLGLPESGADTYIGMMDTDLVLIVNALK